MMREGGLWGSLKVSRGQKPGLSTLLCLYFHSSPGKVLKGQREEGLDTRWGFLEARYTLSTSMPTCDCILMSWAASEGRGKNRARGDIKQ